MKKIGICDGTEYGKRLSNYLVRSLTGDIRIHHFTNWESLREYSEAMDFYLMDRNFYQNLRECGLDVDVDRILFLTDSMEEDGCCKWNHPRKIIELLERKGLYSYGERRSMESNHSLVAVYCPYPTDIRRGIWHDIERGSLFLGFEDMGAPFLEEYRDDSLEETAELSDTGELCYFIRLREENVLNRLDELVSVEDGRFYLNSPDWYFDLRGISEEDFRWFCQLLKGNHRYRNVYMGFGNSVIPSLSFFEMFDRLILWNPFKKEGSERFFEKLTEMLIDQGYQRRDAIENRRI